jgi:uncharacterized membrane protein YqjE
MPDPHAPSSGSPGPDSPSRPPAGLKENVLELLHGGVQHVRLLATLFSLEASAAGSQLGRLAVAVVVFLFGAGLAYVAGWVALVVWMARHWAGGDFVPPLATAAGVHALVAAAAAAWIALRGRKQPFFPATRAEIAEDQQWLRHPKP